MAQIIDGKALAAVVRSEVAAEVQRIQAQGGTVRFAAVLVGENTFFTRTIPRKSNHKSPPIIRIMIIRIKTNDFPKPFNAMFPSHFNNYNI